jgi:CubicO group peptidase (beta-lactamase class C family)
MKWLKRIGIGLGIIVVAIIALGFWVASGLLEVPDLGEATHVDSHIYDPTYAEAIEEVQANLVDARTRLNAPGISIAISVGGELVWAEAQGYADVESGVTIDISSRFHMGSIGKPFTAAVAVQLAEQDLLDLDADIHTYVPSFPEQDYTLTTRQLLSHQAGIRHYRLALIPPLFQERGRNVQFDSVTDSLSLFADDDLLFEPDTGFQYSTYGYTLASAAMESASGMEFLQLMDERLFGPLGMKNTLAHDDTNPAATHTMGYISVLPGDDVIPEPQTNSSYKWAGGGFLSTPIDLNRFGNALLAGDIVSPEMVQLMMTSRTMANGEPNPQRYGLGFRQGGLYYPADTENIIPYISHGGTTIGVVSVLVVLPESGLVLAMVANSSGDTGSSGQVKSEAAGIVRIFLDHMGYVPEGFDASELARS